MPSSLVTLPLVTRLWKKEAPDTRSESRFLHLRHFTYWPAPTENDAALTAVTERTRTYGSCSYAPRASSMAGGAVPCTGSSKGGSAADLLDEARAAAGQEIKRARFAHRIDHQCVVPLPEPRRRRRPIGVSFTHPARPARRVPPHPDSSARK